MNVLSTRLALRFVSKLRRTMYSDSRMIVLSSMPKSGSTFLARSLVDVTGYRDISLACAWGNVEEELYLPKVIDAYGRGTVAKQHFRANSHNIEVLETYRIRPVVLVRNVFDAFVSVRDHFEHESLHNLPGLYVDDRLLELDFERQMDFIIDIMGPWYIGYFVSWCKAEASGVPFLWMSYEDAIADWPSAVSRVLEYYGVHRPLSEIIAATDTLTHGPRRESRLNQGIVGRGNRMLSPSQRKKLVQLTRYYDCDFSRIGIDSIESTFGG